MTALRRNLLPCLGFLALALALRATTFGDPDRQVDEAFYWLVGQRLHTGAIPYVTIWDRKPLGLFAIYAALASLGTSVWIYQLAACAAAALTAWLVSRLVAELAGEGQGGPTAGFTAGLAYLATLLPFEGDSGQAPDFYNPLVAAAALLIVSRRAELARGRAPAAVWLAMLLCGLAITVKQTALFESAFLGLWTCATLYAARLPLPRLAAHALGFAALGALPMLAIVAGYAAIGHWPEFWHAMVLSNLAKARVGGESWRLVGIGLRVAPLTLLATAGLFAKTTARRFTALWLLAALIGFLSVPNVYGHYLLPVLVPLSVAAGLFLTRTPRRWLLTAALTVWALFWETPPPRAQAQETARALTDMASWTRAHDSGGGLLVLDGPPLLYLAAHERFLSPLVFPNHLDHAIEANVSHLNTAAEIDRILAHNPGVIALAQTPRNQPVNAHSYAAVQAYIAARCHARHQAPAIGRYAANPIILFGDCR
ncbi:MAG: hypothetical protein KGN34_08395 [Sphingomonadales bacterium]|nr:hypothetical protein [Sphingomonadales bacterium]